MCVKIQTVQGFMMRKVCFTLVILDSVAPSPCHVCVRVRVCVCVCEPILHKHTCARVHTHTRTLFTFLTLTANCDRCISTPRNLFFCRLAKNCSHGFLPECPVHDHLLPSSFVSLSVSPCDSKDISLVETKTTSPAI